MLLWSYLFAVALLVPVIMLVAGRWMWKRTPKRNHLMGYRTKRSMKDDAAWELGNQTCGRLWWKWGRFLLIPTGIVMAMLYGEEEQVLILGSVLLIVLQLVPLFWCVAGTEKALKQREGQ